MKALSVKQPFAGLIAAGVKRLETRTWETTYRGPLLICAGLNAHSLFYTYRFDTEMVELDNHRARRAYPLPKSLFVPSGVMLCVVDLVGVRTFLRGTKSETDACCDWYANAYAWELENPRPVQQTEVKGLLRLFDVPDALIHITSTPVTTPEKEVP